MNKKVPEGWQRYPVGALITESRIPLNYDDPTKRLAVKLHLKGVEKRQIRATDRVGSTTYFKRRRGQFIYGKQNLHKGALGIVPKAYDGYSSSQDIPTFDFNGICDPEWFLQYFNQVDFYRRLEKIASGTGSKRIQPKDLLLEKIVCPPLPEQKKIASILTSVDEVIENTQQQIEKLRDLKKAVMNELLTKGIGHTEFKDSELGRIPKSWEVSCLADIVCENPSYGANAPAVSSKNSDIRFLRITDITEEGKLRSDSKAYIKKEDAVGYELHKDDLVIARTGNTVGKTYLHSKNTKNVNASEKIAYAGYLILFRFDNERARPKFIFQYTLSRMFKNWVDENSRVGAQPNINAQEYLSFSLPLPPVNEQDRIIEMFSSMDKDIEEKQRKLQKTDSLKKALMQDLLTGKVRVKVN